MTEYENMFERTKRFYYIDLLKALAMFFVLSYHSTFYDFDIIKNSSVLTYLRYFCSTVVATSIPMFFFSNGYLLFSKELDLKKHYKKTIRFMILTFIWSVMTLAIMMPIKGEWLSRSEFLRGILDLKQDWNNHLWFMYVLVAIYVIFPLLKLVHDKKQIIFHVIVIIYGAFIALLVLLNAIATFTPHFRSLNLPKFAFDATFSGLYFWIGGFVYDYRNKFVSIPLAIRNKYAVISLIVSECLLGIFGVAYSKANGEMWDVVFNSFNIIMTLISVLAIFALALNYQRNNKIINLISINTLGIYFIHMPIIRLVKPWIISHPYPETMWFTGLFALVLMFVCIGLVTIIKKIPVIKNLVM